MQKNNRVYLLEILEYVDDIQTYLKRFDFEKFENERLVQDAVIRKIELIGEIAKRLSDGFWDQYREILPLAEAVATRNKLIHEYDDVNLEIIWNTAKKDLWKLKREILKIV